MPSQLATNRAHLLHFPFPARRGGRVVEGGGLESRCAVPPYRGFESLPLRHPIFPVSFDSPHHSALPTA
jgi:hypothetical protein